MRSKTRVWSDLAIDPKSKGKREGEREEHEEHEEFTHTRQPDTTDTYPRGSMDYANRINPEETRSRIPSGEIGEGDESRSGRESGEH